MNRGVEILLARMDSNPEEFVLNDKNYRWKVEIEVVLNKASFLTQEETLLCAEKFRSLQGEWFSKHVMKKLLVAEQEDK